MDETNERRLRRRAVHLHQAGYSLRAIGQRLQRAPQWVAKWVKRFVRGGGPSLRSRSRRPKRQPTKTTAWRRSQVLRLRRRLQRARLGLIGAPAIQQAWRKERLPVPVPAETVIKRILRSAGLTRPKQPPPAAYFPAPRPAPAYPLHAMDWTERYLQGGTKVYAFHTLDLASRAAKQTIRPDKNGASVRLHTLHTLHTLHAWKCLGMPAFLQLDNDAAFNGGYKVKRGLGQFVRLCLYVGVELIFLPVGEAERNGAVESFNGLWNRALFRRNHFETVADAQASTAKFEHWYRHEYVSPQLDGLTVAQATAQAKPGRRLTAAQRAAIPERLPITAGRLHFIRRVNAEGTVILLNESWRVGKRLAGQYVWATVSTHRQTLSLYHRRAADQPTCLLRVYAYPLSEPVAPLRPPFQSGQPRRKVSTMS